MAYPGGMSAAALEKKTVLPPQDLEAMLDLSKFLDQVPAPAALVGPDGQSVALPAEAFRVLADVVHAMREGKAITVVPIDQLLTTQEAATFLGVSRPTLVRLLEAGEIAFERPSAGRHRRVRLEDVLEYQRRRRTERRAALDELTHEAQDVTEATPSEVAEAVKAARKRSG